VKVDEGIKPGYIKNMRIAFLMAGFLLFSSLSFAQDSLNGHFRTYYPDGRVNGTGTRVNGKLEGVALGFWPDGTIKIKSFYKNGRLHGKTTLYYKNGKPQADVEYIKGHQDGPTVEYDESGRPWRTRHFKWGKEHGLRKEFYHQTGVVHYEQMYDNGKAVYLREYYPGGAVKGTYGIDKGVKSGKASEFFVTGEVSRSGMFKNGHWDGLVTDYYQSGKVLGKVYYKNGMKNDDNWQQFYETGELMSVVKVINDKKEGVARELYPDGKTLSEGVFKNGRRQGVFKTFDQKGIRVAEEEFENDIIRYHRQYGTEGKLVAEKIYYNPLGKD
jgi:uncharacterized protein